MAATLPAYAGFDPVPPSSVLQVSSDVAHARAQGRRIIDLSIGDFDSRWFSPPPMVLEAVARLLREGRTNYPPPAGYPDLREAVAAYYHRTLSWSADPANVLVQAGARPLLYACFRLLVRPGDVVVCSVPSWNNEAFAGLCGANLLAVTGHRELGFAPRPQDLEAHLRQAALLVLNSPLNPTGAAIGAEDLRTIAELVVDENRRRQTIGRRPLWLLYDQVYWALTFGGTRHAHPAALLPAVAPWTITVDAVSKAFCATGMRVGWGVLPEALVPLFTQYLSHVGSWSPAAEQLAFAGFLQQENEVDDFLADVGARLRSRVKTVELGIASLAAEGLPVDFVRPDGGIYVTASPGLRGSDEDIRALLLDAGLAVVPFSAFGMPATSGWYRFAVASASDDELAEVPERLRLALQRC